MAHIRVQHDPTRITKCDEYHFNGNLLEWMEDNLPPSLAELHCIVTLNSVVIVDTSKDDDGAKLDESLDIMIGEFDSVVMVFRPAGFDPFTAAIIFVAIAVGSYVIAQSLIPDIPAQTNDGSASNNQLNSSSNGYRPNEAFADIAGQVVSYPDFAQLSYYVYNAAGRRVFREIMFIGIGYYDLQDWKIGDTPFDDVAGSSVTVYEPGSMPPNLLNVRAVPNAENTDLINPASTDQIVNTNSGFIEDTTITIGASAIGVLQASIGDNIELNLECIEGGDGSPATVTGTYAVVSVTSASITLDWSNSVAYSIVGGYLINKSFTFDPPWYTLAGDEINEVRFHLKMPTGIRSGDGNNATVTATLTIERLDSLGEPTGVTYSRAASFTGNTQQAQAATFVINSDFGLTTPGRFRARVVRVTSSLGDNSLDLLQLERLESVKPYTADFGFVTTVEVNRVTPTTGGASRSSDKINVLATRKLRIYNNTTGVYGATYEPTRRFCDYVFYLLYERAGVPLEYIDTDSLFGIHDNLTDAQLGQFDYTFDDKNIGLKERVQAACNVARVVPWNDGLVWSFVRDEAKTFKTTMFNRRNLQSASHQFVQQFRRPADYDSVTISYVDPVKNTKVQISRKINTTTDTIEVGVGIRPLEIELIGCRNALQATNRVELEVRRLVYQGITVTDVALNDALYVQKGARVDWVDMYDSELFSGEVLEVSGNQYRTSERFIPSAGVEYWVYLTDNTGAVSNSVRAYPRTDGNIFGFQADGLTGAYLAMRHEQLGSRYVIASNSDFDASTFIFDGRSRPNEKGECEITLIEYNELMYSED